MKFQFNSQRKFRNNPFQCYVLGSQ